MTEYFQIPFKTFKISLDYAKPSQKALLLAKKYGFLPYMVERYIKMLNDLEEVEALLRMTGQGLPKSIRCNTLKINCDRLKERLESKNLELREISWFKKGFYVLKGSEKIGYLHEYLFGYYFIQGASSMIPPLELNPSPTDIVLDMCAAPGGKTTHLAELMGNEGVIVAIELNRERMKTLRSNISRMGVSNTILIRTDARKISVLKEKFSKILLDAPCTGEGLLPIDPTRKTKTKLEDLYRTASRQIKLIKAAIEALAPGGELVYSTCSIAPEENEFVINEVLNMFDNIKLGELSVIPSFGVKGFTEVFGTRLNSDISKCYRIFPHKHEMEGFFICKIVKI